jgi:uncharacterized protein DUF2071
VRIRLDVENLLLASWEIEPEAIERVTPSGLEPATVDGRHLVSLVSFRVRGGRAGRIPVLPFSQLNVRTYVRWKGECAVFFLAQRVSAAGLAGVVFGAPYRAARIRVRPGEVSAPGLGLALRYRPTGPAEPGELGRHELGIFESGGLEGIRITRAPAEWHAAELVEPPRADLLLAYGFPARGEPGLVYAPRASFATARPARIN